MCGLTVACLAIDLLCVLMSLGQTFLFSLLYSQSTGLYLMTLPYRAYHSILDIRSARAWPSHQNKESSSPIEKKLYALNNSNCSSHLRTLRVLSTLLMHLMTLSKALSAKTHRPNGQSASDSSQSCMQHARHAPRVYCRSSGLT